MPKRGPREREEGDETWKTGKKNLLGENNVQFYTVKSKRVYFNGHRNFKIKLKAVRIIIKIKFNKDRWIRKVPIILIDDPLGI